MKRANSNQSQRLKVSSTIVFGILIATSATVMNAQGPAREAASASFPSSHEIPSTTEQRKGIPSTHENYGKRSIKTEGMKEPKDTDTERKRKYTVLPDTEKQRLYRDKIRMEYEEQRKEFTERHPDIDVNQPSNTRSNKLRNMKPQLDAKNRMTTEEVNSALQHRRTWGKTEEYNAYDLQGYLADPGATYDEWAQAYRTLGVFIDCDHVSGSGDSGDGGGCPRWMMWAAYVDPNYQGGGYYEYHKDGDDDGYDDEYDNSPVGSLDCHTDTTEWLLLGVYRQEFFQYLEQISKHLWSEDDWEYITAVSTLEYIGEDECVAVGYDNNAAPIYAGIQPMEMGDFQMGLYLDEDCLYPQDENLGYTYDDFYNGDGDRRRLGDDDGGWWAAAQEYTLAYANEIYSTFKYCTHCIDYPTYQDGQINGDNGYDEGDLINQCWKFYSHDSFTCSAECLRNGHRQGGLTNIIYGNNYFGTKFYDDSTEATWTSKKSSSTAEDTGTFKFTPEKFDRLKANVYVTFSGILFIATFLAFSVARSNSDAVRKRIPGRHSRSKRRSRRSKSIPKTESLLGEDPSLGNGDEGRSKSRTRLDRRTGSKDKTASRGRYDPPDSSSKTKPSPRKPRRHGKHHHSHKRDKTASPNSASQRSKHRSRSRGGNSSASKSPGRYRVDDF